jgi:hypothetical protein
MLAQARENFKFEKWPSYKAVKLAKEIAILANSL